MRLVEYQLGVNEFYNIDDKVGLFTAEIEPETFFSIENVQDGLIADAKALGIGAGYEGSDRNMPSAKISFELSDIKRTHER